jgi:hypothetical protein
MRAAVTRRRSVLSLGVLLLLAPSIEGQPPEDCTWTFTGRSRKAVKNRSPEEGKSYRVYAHGRPISLAHWFTLTCSLDARVPREVPEYTAMNGIETIVVTLRGYLLAARFQRKGDKDIHAEIGARPEWETDHVIVEVPPGPDFCDARKTLWGLVRRDIEAARGDRDADTWIMKKPVTVLMRGFVFLDSPHATEGSSDHCHDHGRRGLRKASGRDSKAQGRSEAKPKRRVRGLWEIHPVLWVKEVSP